MTAHDVRHLTVCPHCNRIGDDREMIKVGREHMHSPCAVKSLGKAGLLKLPKAERGKIRFCDLNLRLARALIS